MFKCATGFDLDSQELALVNQILSKEEKQTADEDHAAQDSREAQCEISDTEEDDLQIVNPQQISKAVERASQSVIHSDSEPEGQDFSEDNNKPGLPSVPTQLTTAERNSNSGLRMSGRICRP